ncbi:tripartite motif-containing protein 16-like protein [Esox lucius]|uniref:B30.2/SPRY domain-containing protein n=1 Tax=Esox lucius TaxID=8010 RepID=A0A3P8YUF1_ESOLU|nr:tripartite motif-containing protein 16-like protein [Esox lucius]
MPLPKYNPGSNGVMSVPKKAGRKSKAAPEEAAPVYEPNIPEPTTRADLMKYCIPLTLDDKTAQKLLWISEGNHKVSRMSEEVCPYPMRPERYEHSPQVLCKEGLLGQRGYWEVDFEGWVVIGAAYESMPRKEGPCGLGENEQSWGAGWAGSCYHVWHKGENTEVELPYCTTVSIYLDQPAGIIKFFVVEGEAEKEVRLIHKFKTTFKDKLLPCFWVGQNSYCWIRKLEGQ